ncbi:MAG: ComF family protein [Verrucomicrobia bacterium]|nr:MAG: ComF family protein [Verrucomicrobiota bacterium]
MDEQAPAGGGGSARPWRALFEGMADVLFPPNCVGCEGLVEADSSFHTLCRQCARRLVLVRPPNCATCGYPFFGAMAESGECPHCAELRPVFGEGRTVTLLHGPMRAVVHALKYRGATWVLRDIRRIVAASPHLPGFLRGATLVPVPLHPRKRRERGYNQAELIARIFTEVAPVKEVAPILSRVVDTPTQTRLDRRGRQANLKNAFALAAGAQVVSDDRYVLVDDVFTTGSTLNACARVLRQAGVRQIDVATLGHG